MNLLKQTLAVFVSLLLLCTMTPLQTDGASTPNPGRAGQEVYAPVPPKDMDALVANVLAKMSPEMLQAVTREILKPVVAAMIRDEINAKKS